jgi:hypothetical protein
MPTPPKPWGLSPTKKIGTSSSGSIVMFLRRDDRLTSADRGTAAYELLYEQ